MKKQSNSKSASKTPVSKPAPQAAKTPSRALLRKTVWALCSWWCSAFGACVPAAIMSTDGMSRNSKPMLHWP